MKNIENLNIQELNTQELKSIYGGDGFFKSLGKLAKCATCAIGEFVEHYGESMAKLGSTGGGYAGMGY